jgi:hypothetical protein
MIFNVFKLNHLKQRNIQSFGFFNVTLVFIIAQNTNLGLVSAQKLKAYT